MQYVCTYVSQSVVTSAEQQDTAAAAPRTLLTREEGAVRDVVNENDVSPSVSLTSMVTRRSVRSEALSLLSNSTNVNAGITRRTKVRAAVSLESVNLCASVFKIS